MRQYLSNPAVVSAGDPAKMLKVMIDSVDQSLSPKRIVLGTDAYTMIQKALTERLAAVGAQKDFASSTDFPADSRHGRYTRAYRESEDCPTIAIVRSTSPDRTTPSQSCRRRARNRRRRRRRRDPKLGMQPVLRRLPAGSGADPLGKDRAMIATVAPAALGDGGTARATGHEHALAFEFLGER
jgi:hypothetical protein